MEEKIKKGQNRQNRLIIVGVVSLIIILSLLLIYMASKGGNPLDNLFKNETVAENKDNYNGFYVYKENLDRSYTAFEGCSVKSLDTYIVVLNKEYQVYRSTCMGTYLEKSGNTTELSFSFDKESQNYFIKFDDKIFKKDITTRSLEPNNNVSAKLHKLDLSSYEFILEQTQFEGNYYDIDSEIYTNKYINIRIQPDKMGGYNFNFYTNDKNRLELYNYFAKDLSVLPSLNAYYDKLIIIEKNTNDYRLTSYNLKTISPTMEADYDLSKMFPITINNQQLTTDNSIYIKYNESKKNYDLLIGYNNNFCYEDSDSDEIAYYHFTIEYDYKNLSLTKPVYQKTIYRKDGCGLYNKIVEG